MSMNAVEMQIEQLKSQISELRSKVDELVAGPQVTEKARRTMEQARQSALEVGQRIARRKGVAIPIGTLVLTGLAIFAVTMLFPQTTEMIRRKWNEYLGKTEE